jgi:EAL and modified HD-GYP domain-containing signal transduction protein
VTLRARFLELLARETGLSKADQDLVFMAGMFSLLGVLFGLPLAEVFKPLQISEVIVAAVQQHAGEIGQLLRLVETTERCDSSAVDEMLCDLDLRTEKFNLIYLEACQWMLNIVCEAAPGTGHE